MRMSRNVQKVLVAMFAAALALPVLAQDKPIGPSDCHRMAVGIEAELEALRAARKVTTPAPELVAVTDKKPGDCHTEARGLVDDLAKVATGDLAIEPAITPVAAPAEAAKPGDVHAALVTAESHISAMLAKAGGTKPELPEVVAGKTPSDVYAEIVRARALAQSLAAK